jgi:hypothetical protein
MRNAVLAGLLVGLVGCADEAADEGGAGGAGGQPADMGMAPEGTTETFTFTELALAQPAALSGILNNLLTNSLNAGDIIILMQVDGWDGNGSIVLRGGAGQQVAGLDTPRRLCRRRLHLAHRGPVCGGGRLGGALLGRDQRAGRHPDR